jgi:hypothetical protein
MANQQRSDVYQLTIDSMKAHRKFFDAKENHVKELITNELVGDLGSKSGTTLRKQLDEAKKMAYDFYTQFKFNMEEVEKKYKSIEGLAEVYMEENNIFILFQDNISVDELRAAELQEQIVLAQAEYQECQEKIFTQKRKFHDTYDAKLT